MWPKFRIRAALLVLSCMKQEATFPHDQRPGGGPKKEDPADAPTVVMALEVEVPAVTSPAPKVIDAVGPKKEEARDPSPPPPPPPPPPPDDIADDDVREDDQLALGEGGNRPTQVNAAAVRSAQGALDPAEVQKAVEGAIESFRPCLRADTVVVLDARVTPDGDVTEAKGVSSKPEDPVARDCVAYAFRKLRFGNTGALEAATFRLSLSLKRRG